MDNSETYKGTSEQTLISSRCGDTHARALWQGEGIPSIGMDLVGCLIMLLARWSGSRLDPVKENRWILEAGANQCAEAHFKSGANIPALGVQM